MYDLLIGERQRKKENNNDNIIQKVNYITTSVIKSLYIHLYIYIRIYVYVHHIRKLVYFSF